MASTNPSLLLATPLSSSSSSAVPIWKSSILREVLDPRGTGTRTCRPVIMAASPANNEIPQKSTKLVSFLGKGGSGKTTSAVFAAQYFAMSGLKTCLVIHSQDPTADYLLNCKIGVSPVTCNNNLSAIRLETTKMLLEPLNRLKQADARINMTQGVLDGVVGEELGVLPGMDSIFSALKLERLIGFFENASRQTNQKDKFDVIVYDGISAEETVRMIGASSKARLYLKYLRNLAEKTDLGRLAGPSLLRLVEESISLSGRESQLNGRMSADIWNDLEQTLERGSSLFLDARRFGCYLVMDTENPTSVNSALRYWGCSIQAGAQVSGAFGIASPNSFAESIEIVKKKLSPLPFSLFPPLSMGTTPDWSEIMMHKISEEARQLLSLETSQDSFITPPVKFDSAKKTISLLMPGFDKSEVKLYQFRGGSELLVEAGDQRRAIRLPSQIQGKVGGAKFIDRSLVITMR